MNDSLPITLLAHTRNAIVAERFGDASMRSVLDTKILCEELTIHLDICYV